MTALKDTFRTRQPRERSGGWTITRYSYQIHFAILKILERHSKDNNYCMLMDYFDDIFLVDDLKNHLGVILYQVKAKSSGLWSIHQICKYDKAKPSPTSIIGKIQHNVCDFSNSIAASHFITNASFGFQLTDGSKSTDDNSILKYSDLHSKETSKLDATIEVECPSPRVKDCRDIVVFQRISMGIYEQKNFVVGTMTLYLAGRKQETDVPALGVYETLFANVVQKSGVTKILDNVDEIFEEKGITGEVVESLFKKAIESQRILTDWSSVEDDLKGIMGKISRARLKTECIRYIHARSNGDSSAISLSKKLQAAAVRNRSRINMCDSYWAAKSIILSQGDRITCDSFSIDAAALVEVYEELVLQ